MLLLKKNVYKNSIYNVNIYFCSMKHQDFKIHLRAAGRCAVLKNLKKLTDKYVVRVESAWLCACCRLYQNQLKNTKK